MEEVIKVEPKKRLTRGQRKKAEAIGQSMATPKGQFISAKVDENGEVIKPAYMNPMVHSLNRKQRRAALKKLDKEEKALKKLKDHQAVLDREVEPK